MSVCISLYFKKSAWVTLWPHPPIPHPCNFETVSFIGLLAQYPMTFMKSTTPKPLKVYLRKGISDARSICLRDEWTTNDDHYNASNCGLCVSYDHHHHHDYHNNSCIVDMPTCSASNNGASGAIDNSTVWTTGSWTFSRASSSLD